MFFFSKNLFNEMHLASSGRRQSLLRNEKIVSTPHGRFAAPPKLQR